jgi:hypothetical protein
MDEFWLSILAPKMISLSPFLHPFPPPLFHLYSNMSLKCGSIYMSGIM